MSVRSEQHRSRMVSCTQQRSALTSGRERNRTLFIIGRAVVGAAGWGTHPKGAEKHRAPEEFSEFSACNSGEGASNSSDHALRSPDFLNSMAQAPQICSRLGQTAKHVP